MKYKLMLVLSLLSSNILVIFASAASPCTYLTWPQKPFCTKYPLHWAATANIASDVEKLLKDGARIDQKTGRGYTGNTALHIASRYGRAGVAQVLIRYGADDTIRNNKGEFAMDRAHIKFCTWNSGNTWCRLGDSDYTATLALLQYGCASTGCATGLNCVGHRCIQRNVHGIAQNAQSNSRYNTQRNTRLIRDACGPQTWYWWTTDRCQNYPFHWAAVAGDEAKVVTYLQQGTKVDLRDGDRYTPLMLAAWAGRAGTVSLLLKNGADTSLTNDRGRTALLLASKNYCRDPNSKGCTLGDVNYDQAVKLLQKGCAASGCATGLQCSRMQCKKQYKLDTSGNESCGPHIRSEWSYQRCEEYPFHWAAVIGDDEEVTRYIRKGTQVDLSDGYEYHRTPLMYAAWAGHASTVLLLLNNGADASITNSKGQTAADLARRRYCSRSMMGCRLGERDYDETLRILKQDSASPSASTKITESGAPCVRYQYLGKWYEASECKCCWNSKPWCATSTSAQGYLVNWEYCQ